MAAAAPHCEAGARLEAGLTAALVRRGGNTPTFRNDFFHRNSTIQQRKIERPTDSSDAAVVACGL